ncbi:endonuclease III domain-containing protein [Halopelagius longus]|uniref:Endonuclease III n=1 Tax=Halopelagius longus TaxID=1236180 RepID=A0A1H1C6M4_9EURY|nr:endonuclease III [Halopelagius longus]RDI71095.1 endonuclease III [Halopelagius longus]SDQ59845.1 endonuclease-3 [Halopelagius longus]
MPEEPAENISGGEAGGGTAAVFEERDAETRAEAVVDELGRLYWRKAYGGQDAFECLVRTILSQNTSDKASQPAHDELMARFGPAEELAETLAEADREEIADAISAAGLYNQKSKMIRGAAREVVSEFGGTEGFDAYVREEDPAAVRERLLEIHGVGPKTADCVLLFAGGRGGVFPVDTHVHRISRRLGVAPPDADHEEVRQSLERDVPAAKCGFGHTAMIQFGREYCSARKPACLDGLDACPMAALCDRVGVEPESGEVVDPAEAAPAD